MLQRRCLWRTARDNDTFEHHPQSSFLYKVVFFDVGDFVVTLFLQDMWIRLLGQWP